MYQINKWFFVEVEHEKWIKRKPEKNKERGANKIEIWKYVFARIKRRKKNERITWWIDD